MINKNIVLPQQYVFDKYENYCNEKISDLQDTDHGKMKIM